MSSDVNNLPLVLTPVDIARILRVSKNTAYEKIHSKGFPYFKVGNQYRIYREKFIEWMQNPSGTETVA